MRIQISVPSNVPLAVIEAALAQFGASVVIAKPKPVKIEREYQPLIYTKSDGTQDEIDGVTVEKAIRKLMSGIEAANRCDGRHKGAYPEFGRGVIDNAQEYMARFCSALVHKPASYTNGVTA